MKESMNKAKLYTVAALATLGSLMAPKEAVAQTTTKPLSPIETIDTFKIPSGIEIQNSYDKNREQNDANYNNEFFWETPGSTEKVLVHYQGISTPSIRVTHYDEHHNRLSHEEFDSLDNLKAKYPEYGKHIDSMGTIYYKQYQIEKGWEALIQEKEQTLLNDPSSYTPTSEELAVIKKAVDVKNQGGTTDGYDEIYHYYTDKMKGPEDMYRFYMKHNCKPETLAHYLAGKYYKPFVATKS